MRGCTRRIDRRGRAASRKARDGQGITSVFRSMKIVSGGQTGVDRAALDVAL
jgi:hypothetical protein